MPKNKFATARRYGLLTAVLLWLSLALSACGSDSTSLQLSTTAASTTAASSTTVAVTTSAATTASNTTSAAPTNATNATTTSATNATTAAGGLGQSGNTGDVNPATTPGASPLAVPTVKVPDATQKQLDVVAQQTEKIRGLTFKQPVERNFMTRQDLSTYQTEQFNRDNPPEEIDKSQKTLAAFGFVGKGFNLKTTYVNLLNEQVLGFYDPETKKLYVITDNDPSKVEPIVKYTMEHELTHGLQDQYYDIQKLRPTRKPSDQEWNDDRDYALTALIEGDAVQSQNIWLQGGNLNSQELQDLLKTASSFQSTQLDNAPLILKDTLVFPYNEGNAFIAQLYKRGGNTWKMIDAAFTSKPPQSTSQILHPDKYFNNVAPVQVPLVSQVDTLGSGWKSLDLNTMGELQARIWLQGAIDQALATSSVSSWAGDRYQVLQNGQGQVGFVWHSQWENNTGASDFYKASLTTVKKLYNLSGDGTGSDTKKSWSGPDMDVTVIQKDKDVLIVVLPKGSGNDKIVSKLGF